MKRESLKVEKERWASEKFDKIMNFDEWWYWWRLYDLHKRDDNEDDDFLTSFSQQYIISLL